jgi:hypothetical protein
MAVTSIPKARLVDLIADNLQVLDQAASYFHVQATTVVQDRLIQFTKDDLLSFILQVEGGEIVLRRLATTFPLRRPPTLYIAVVEKRPITEGEIIEKSRQLADLGRGGGISFRDKDSVRFLYLPQAAVTHYNDKLPVIEYQMQYEYRMEFVQSSVNAENYGQLDELYSLETAFIWLPVEKYSHAIIACSDYSALRRIRYFLNTKLDIELNIPWLNKEMVERITNESAPRSVTFSLNTFSEDPKQVQSITISDPLLAEKDLYAQMKDMSPDREQVSGFYIAHPGLALGGIGVTRRDGKIWTPRRLNHDQLIDLSLAIIKQTEMELEKTESFTDLSKYFLGNHAKIAEKELQGDARKTWVELMPFIFEAAKNEDHEREIPIKLLNNLIHHQKALKLLTMAEYECPTCGVRLLARCPDPECQATLILEYVTNNIIAICPKCQVEYLFRITCSDCGTTIDVDSFANLVRIIPDTDCNKSVHSLAKKFKVKFLGSWGIQGLTIKYVIPRKKLKYPLLSLSDFQLWRSQAKMEVIKGPDLATDHKIHEILNDTKEKCKREGTKPSGIKCGECNKSPIDPEWIVSGQTCLLRLFGIPIGKGFDGVHHKHEVADLRYKDILVNTGEAMNIGIHVKSRCQHPPTNGVGRTNYSVKGLYTQAIFSAFDSAVRGENLQAIGVGMPNKIFKEVIDSLAYAINSLGFSFIVVAEEDWAAIVKIAYEQSVFDFGK